MVGWAFLAGFKPNPIMFSAGRQHPEDENMRHTWRWFGPIDKVSVRDAAQAGAQGIVSALHHIPAGVAWTGEAIRERQNEVRAGGLEWELVESIPISESIKTMSGDWRAH